MKKFFHYLLNNFSWFVRKLPVRVQFAAGDFFAFLWFDVFRIRRKLVRSNLTLAFPEMNESEKTRIGRASIQNMGRGLIEFLKMPSMSRSDFREQFDFFGEEHLAKARAEGKGVLLLTLHLGNGDYAVSALSQAGYPMHLITKEFKTKWLNQLWFGIRERLGTRLIAARKTSYEILKALKEQGIVAFVLDQHMGPPLGVKTSFFGHTVGTALGLALFAARTKAPVVAAYTIRLPNGRGEVHFEPGPKWEELGSHEDTLRAMTQKYNDQLETFVRRYPEQWLWVHRRWKKFG